MTNVIAQATLIGHVRKKSALVLICLFAGIVALAMPALAAAEPETRILILNATDPYLPAYQVIDAAMRETLAKDTTRRFEYFSETLDWQRFNGKQYEAELLALLVKKYKGLRIDVVVAVTQPALDFVNDHGAELWPGASIVFHGVSARKLENVALPARATGVFTREDVGGTLDLALRLQPRAGRILVIAGVAEVDQSLADLTRKVLATPPPTAAVEFLIGLPLAELLERVKREAADTIILYLTEYRDRDGRPYTPRDVARAIGAVSAAPAPALRDLRNNPASRRGVDPTWIAGAWSPDWFFRWRERITGCDPVAVPNRCIATRPALVADEGRLPQVWKCLASGRLARISLQTSAHSCCPVSAGLIVVLLVSAATSCRGGCRASQ